MIAVRAKRGERAARSTNHTNVSAYGAPCRARQNLRLANPKKNNESARLVLRAVRSYTFTENGFGYIRKYLIWEKIQKISFSAIFTFRSFRMPYGYRAFGDFEADLKRSDSGHIPHRKAWFLALICSLNTFQSKNPSHPLPSLHFQSDEK